MDLWVHFRVSASPADKFAPAPWVIIIEHWYKWVFLEIRSPDRLVFVSSFSDLKGNVTRHPLSASWPLETLSTLSLIEDGGRTIVRLEAEPINATAEEMSTFASAYGGMTQGWAGTFGQYETYLATLVK